MTRFVCILALFAVPAAQAADLPAVVIQVQPVGKVLSDIKAAARMVAGEPAVQHIEDFLKQQLGDKGLEGVDLTRPVVAYATLRGAKALDDNTPAVLAVPITGEAEFLDFLKRAKSTVEPVEGKKGLYKVISPRTGAVAPPKGPSLLRFHEGYAYAGEVPIAQLDPENLPPAGQLVTPGETGLVAVRVYFDRLPEEVRAQVGSAIDKALQELKSAPVPDDADAIKAKAIELAQKMATRYLTQAREANEGIVRVLFDATSGEAAMEFGLTGRNGTSLAKDIRARAPTTNRFAAAVGTDTVAALLWSFPLLKTEFGEILALGFEEGATRELNQQDEKVRPVLRELIAGAIRTVRAGEVDVAVAASGPAKSGHFSVVAAVSFADPSGLEKELRVLFEKEAPPSAKEMVAFDAAKVNGVRVHVVTPPPGAVPMEAATRVFGEGAKVGVAFAPRGILVAVGADPVATLKPVLTAKPQPARVLDVLVHPARIRKIVAAAEGVEQVARTDELLGTADELLSMIFFSVDGGDELRLQVGFNLKLLSKSATWFGFGVHQYK